MLAAKVVVNLSAGVEFRNRLQTEFDGVNLPNSMVFDYPTVTDAWRVIGWYGQTRVRTLSLVHCQQRLRNLENVSMNAEELAGFINGQLGTYSTTTAGSDVPE